MRTSALFTAVALAGLGFVTSPASAADITVHLDVDLAGAVEHADCDLDVADGATGIDLLDAAVDDGCIDSYDTQTHPSFGEFVTCIDGICAAPDEALNIVFWSIYVDCDPSLVGASDMSLEDGDVVEFSYETWATMGAVSTACAVEELPV